MTQTDSLMMLQFLEMILKHGNYTKAAKSLYISQPYLTQVIKKKEAELGVSLIDRQTHPLQLTEAGKLYFQYLTKLLEEKNRFTKKLERFSSPNQMTLRIGILTSLGTYVLPLILPSFLKRHPYVQIELSEDLPSKNEKRLLNHQLDFFIGQNPETLAPSLTAHTLTGHGYYAIVPRSSPLFSQLNAQATRTDLLVQLLNEPLVLTLHGSAIRQQIDYLIQKLRIQPTILLESNNIYTLGRLAQENLGVTFLPDSVFTPENPDAYAIYHLPQADLSLTYFLAYPKEHVLNEVESAFLADFLACVADDIKQT